MAQVCHLCRLPVNVLQCIKVAALWGEDADADSDVEDTPATAMSKTKEEKEDHAAEFEKELNEQQR